MSLENATYQQVKDLLETSPLTHDAEFTFESDYIRWEWSPTVEQWLISSEYPSINYYWYGANSIRFSRGTVFGVSLRFALPLKDIIDVFGDNFRVHPYASTGRWNVYGLVYDQTIGIFTTSLQCSNPTISADALIESYEYRKMGFDPTLDDPEMTIPWQGYATQLQDCSFFQAG